MPDFKLQLMNSPYFQGVSAQTKTDILNTIEFELDDTGFTNDELALGLRYILAQNNQKYKIYIQPQPETSYYRPDPYFGVPNSTDWVLLYLVASNNRIGHHHHFHGGGNISRGSSSSSSNLDGRAVLIACAFALACICCCIGAFANYQTTQSNERNNLKTGKIILSLLCFAIAAIPTFIFMDQIKSATYEPGTLNEDAEASLQFVVPFLAGATAYCTFATLFALIPCVRREPRVAAPSAELLAVLQPVKRLLDGEWVRPGDSPEQVVAFVKTVIRLSLEEMSKPKQANEKTPLYSAASIEPKQHFELDHYLHPIPSAPIAEDVDDYKQGHGAVYNV